MNREDSCFNSRAREGRDISAVSKRWIEGVSTHAPARGATFEDYYRACEITFQLTRPRGARRLELRSLKAATLCFNSRAREGRDYGGNKTMRDQSSFNSRAREGRDCKP